MNNKGISLVTLTIVTDSSRQCVPNATTHACSIEVPSNVEVICHPSKDKLRELYQSSRCTLLLSKGKVSNRRPSEILLSFSFLFVLLLILFFILVFCFNCSFG